MISFQLFLWKIKQVMGGGSRGKDGELDESYGEKNDPSDHEDNWFICNNHLL